MTPSRGFGWLILFLGACGPAVEPARPVANEFIEVDYPPPPAQIEEMTDYLAGRPDCTWVDGYYVWRGRRWEWVRGLWGVVAPRCARAPATLTWSKGAQPRLYYTPPSWYRTDATAASTARSSCPTPTPCLSLPPSALPSSGP